MIATRITNPATLHRYVAGAKDEMGDPTHTFVDVATKAEIQEALTATEAYPGGVPTFRSVARPTAPLIVFLPPDETFTARDELTVRGVRYAFDGDPWLVRNPRTGRLSHWSGRVRKANT